MAGFGPVATPSAPQPAASPEPTAWPNPAPSHKAYPRWTNSLVTRTGVTIKAETVSRWLFDSTAVVDAARYGFERYFYEHRPYTVIGDNMPAQWTQAWYQKSHPLSLATDRIVHNLLILGC